MASGDGGHEPVLLRRVYVAQRGQVCVCTPVFALHNCGNTVPWFPHIQSGKLSGLSEEIHVEH